jgi:TolB-like protein/Tfp pilus assembly protein PilF
LTSLFEELKRRNVVRVAVAYLTAAWLIAQLISTLGDLVQLPDWAGPLLLIVLTIGFFVAIVLAWFYELTTQGLKAESEVESNPALRRIPARYFDFAIIALLALALGYFIWESRFQIEPGSTSEIITVAVMPFEDLSPAGDQQWFATGMTDEIMTALVRIPLLRIAGRRSVQQFDPSTQSISEFADRIGVSHVLEGSIRTAGGRVRVSAQLVRVADGFNVWSDAYDEQLAEVFSIQDRIADNVIDGLRVHLLAAERPVPIAIAEQNTDFEGYKLYLQGRFYLARRTKDDLEQAIRFLESALEKDDQRSRTHSALASVYAVMPYYAASRSPAEMSGAARYHAHQALALDDTNAEAHAILGVLHMTKDRDWTSAAAAFRRAYELAPGSVDVNNLYGDFHYMIGDFVAAEEREAAAARLDPLSAVNQLELGLVHAFRGEFDKAIRQAELAIELNRSLPNARWQRFRSTFLAGDIGAAQRILEEEKDVMGEVYAAEGGVMLAAHEQRYDDARTIAQELAATRGRAGVPATKLALMFALARDDETAARFLERAYDSGDAVLVSPMHFFLPEDWPNLPEVQSALDKPELNALFALRRSFIEAGTGRAYSAYEIVR